MPNKGQDFDIQNGDWVNVIDKTYKTTQSKTINWSYIEMTLEFSNKHKLVDFLYK